VWLDDKRHAQQCRSICAVDSGKDAIQNVIEKARWRCRAEQLTAKRHDENEIVAGMQTKRGQGRRPSVAWLNKKQSRKAEVKGEKYGTFEQQKAWCGCWGLQSEKHHDKTGQSLTAYKWAASNLC